VRAVLIVLQDKKKALYSEDTGLWMIGWPAPKGPDLTTPVYGPALPAYLANVKMKEITLSDLYDLFKVEFDRKYGGGTI
jgi:hypothetical protein